MKQRGFQRRGHREIRRENLDSTLKFKDSFSSFLCDLCVLCVECHDFYAEDFTGSSAITERYTSRTCSADRSHEYF